MSETATGEPTKTASGAHDDQELNNFPLLQDPRG